MSPRTYFWVSTPAPLLSVMCIRALFGSEWYNQVDRIEMLLYIVLCSEMIRGLVCLHLNDTIELLWYCPKSFMVVGCRPRKHTFVWLHTFVWFVPLTLTYRSFRFFLGAVYTYRFDFFRVSYFPMCTQMGESGAISVGFRSTGLTPAGFKEAFLTE